MYPPKAGRWPLVTRRNIKWEGIGSAASRRPTAVSHLNFWADDEDWDDPGDGGGDFVISSLSALAGEVREAGSFLLSSRSSWPVYGRTRAAGGGR